MPRYTPTTTTISNRFQLHIPLAIRQQLNLTKPTTAEIWTDNDTICIRPHYSKIIELAGVLRDKKPVKDFDIDNMRDEIDYSNLP